MRDTEASNWLKPRVAGSLLLTSAVAFSLLPRMPVQATAPYGYWYDAGDMSVQRLDHTVTTLHDGTALVAGGNWQSGARKDVDRYDPSRNRWVATPDMRVGRMQHSATLLRDGRVFVTGGYKGKICCLQAQRSTEFYDPRASRWSLASDSQHPHGRHTASLLPDGRVLVAGNDGGDTFSYFEIYDPSSNTWSYAPQPPGFWTGQLAVTLGDGRVLLTANCGYESSLGAALFDPGAVTWSVSEQHVSHCGGGASLLGDGRVLVTGGGDSWPPTATVEIFDPLTNSWTVVAPMTFGKTGHIQQTLPDGRVLVAGGADTWGSWQHAQVYDPVGEAWTDAPGSTEQRLYAKASSLLDGRVFLTGGYASGLGSAEVFDPRLRTGFFTPSIAVQRGRFAARLFYEWGNVLPGRLVRFEIAYEDICTAVTDADGWARCLPSPDRLTRTAELIATNDRYTATFEGDETYGYARESGSLRFSLSDLQQPPNIPV